MGGRFSTLRKTNMNAIKFCEVCFSHIKLCEMSKNWLIFAHRQTLAFYNKISNPCLLVIKRWIKMLLWWQPWPNFLPKHLTLLELLSGSWCSWSSLSEKYSLESICNLTLSLMNCILSVVCLTFVSSVLDETK